MVGPNVLSANLPAESGMSSHDMSGCAVSKSVMSTSTVVAAKSTSMRAAAGGGGPRPIVEGARFAVPHRAAGDGIGAGRRAGYRRARLIIPDGVAHHGGGVPDQGLEQFAAELIRPDPPVVKAMIVPCAEVVGDRAESLDRAGFDEADGVGNRVRPEAAGNLGRIVVKAAGGFLAAGAEQGSGENPLAVAVEGAVGSELDVVEAEVGQPAQGVDGGDAGNGQGEVHVGEVEVEYGPAPHEGGSGMSICRWLYPSMTPVHWAGLSGTLPERAP